MSEMFECDICSGMVSDEDKDSINAAIIGEPITLKGHKVCLKNINGIVVTPSRNRLNLWQREILELVEQHFSAERQRRSEILLRYLEVIKQLDPDGPME